MHGFLLTPYRITSYSLKSFYGNKVKILHYFLSRVQCCRFLYKVFIMQVTYINQQDSDGSVTMRLYGSLGTDMDGNLFARKLAEQDGIYPLIKIRINSPGGDVFQGMSIVSAMLSMNTPIHVYIDGVAASMAAVIAVCGTKIYMQDFAKLMIHDPYFSGHGIHNDRDDKTLGRIREMLCRVLSRRGKSEPEVARLMSDETWFSADEALRNGLCDKVMISGRSNLKALMPWQIVAQINTEYKLLSSMEHKDKNQNNNDLREQLIVLLSLDTGASDSDILDAVAQLLQQAGTNNNYISEALRMGYVDKTQAVLFYGLDEAGKERLRACIEDKKKEDEQRSNGMILQAVRIGKFDSDRREVFDFIGKKMGASVLGRLLDAIPLRPSIAAMIQRGSNTDRTTWGLDEYRRNDPQELKNNPALYARLLEEERNKKRENKSK